MAVVAPVDVPSYINRSTFGDWFFGSPDNFPSVLTLMNVKAIVWSVSSQYEETPMAGIVAQQRDGITIIPEPEEVLRIGQTSPWAFCAFDLAQPPNQIFSLFYQNTPFSFEYVFNLDSNILTTPFNIEVDPDELNIGHNFIEIGRAIFSGTNFLALALVKPDGGHFFAVVDRSIGLSSPAYAVDINSRTLFLPNYAVNRPIDPAFGLVAPSLTPNQVAVITTGVVIVGAAVLAALPFTRELFVGIGKALLHMVSNVIPIAGYGEKVLDIASNFLD